MKIIIIIIYHWACLVYYIIANVDLVLCLASTMATAELLISPRFTDKED